MNLTIEEFLSAVHQANPQLDLSEIDENTDIRTGAGLDSLQMMLVFVILSDNYDIDMEKAAAAQTVGEFCSIAVKR